LLFHRQTRISRYTEIHRQPPCPDGRLRCSGPVFEWLLVFRSYTYGTRRDRRDFLRRRLSNLLSAQKRSWFVPFHLQQFSPEGEPIQKCQLLWLIPIYARQASVPRKWRVQGRILKERLVIVGADRKQTNLLQDPSCDGQSTAAKLSITEQDQCGGYAEQRNRKIDWHSKGDKEGLQDLSQNGILIQYCEGIGTDIVYLTRTVESRTTVAERNVNLCSLRHPHRSMLLFATWTWRLGKRAYDGILNGSKSTARRAAGLSSTRKYDYI